MADEKFRPRVPGARATTVHATFWDLAFETVSRSRSNLSSLFHRICSTRSCAQQLPRKEVWPMPLPFPEMHCQRARRQQAEAPRKLGLNYLVLVLNFLLSAEKPVDTGNIGLGTRLTKQQWEVVRSIRPLVDSWNEHGVVDSDAMGRSAAKVENIEQLLEQLESEAQASPICSSGYNMHRSQQTDWTGVSGHPGDVISTCSQKVEHLAKDIDASRLRFHEEPSFDPIRTIRTVNIFQDLLTLQLRWILRTLPFLESKSGVAGKRSWNYLQSWMLQIDWLSYQQGWYGRGWSVDALPYLKTQSGTA